MVKARQSLPEPYYLPLPEDGPASSTPSSSKGHACAASAMARQGQQAATSSMGAPSGRVNGGNSNDRQAGRPLVPLLSCLTVATCSLLCFMLGVTLGLVLAHAVDLPL
jgi:hypothetical protein